ncbi:transposase [Pelosinus baikalensis]|uniref:Transposase n=1 Tax=Pelosinus baikalensis TaxID=2892015 RepID=A0ABS8HYF4_9FIRM|nr:transposase [Pelosinus baikalensis]MCC5468185.1 transposase [Pelosinus baikalensis]
MTGNTIPKDQIKVSEFIINETNHKVECCPVGKAPLYAQYQEDKEVYRAKFAKPDCENCPLLPQCPIEIKKEMNTLRFTEKKLQVDRMRTVMTSEECCKLADFRAGEERIPSVLWGIELILIPI